MDKISFKKWRKKNGFSQQQAADVLGLKRRMIQYYEKGKKGDKIIQIPKYIQLACEGFDLKNKIKKLINAKGDSI
jgi:transcriptional regulator with XRE-family HTH domain